jgi:hypothetical protein
MKTLSTFLFLAIFSVHSLVFAGLGEKESSLEKDMKALSLQEKNKDQSDKIRYSVHELSQGSLTVKEYVSHQGVVFGVAWTGNTHPDLTALLGPYLGEYQDALKANKSKLQKGHKKIGRILTKHLVIERRGQMRAVQGRAYVPTLIPDGVTENEIQ